jgi:hypothetical protein
VFFNVYHFPHLAKNMSKLLEIARVMLEGVNPCDRLSVDDDIALCHCIDANPR